MLKLIITLIFSVFLNFSLSLAGDLKLSCDVEPAWIPRVGNAAYQTPKDILYKSTKNAFCLTIKPAFDWRFVYGYVELIAFSAAPKKGIFFSPFRMSYSNEIGLYHQFPSVKISTGWLHNCQHRVVVANYNDPRSYYNDTSYDVVFMRFHFSN